jgi:ABC-type molybdate transport system permease subunit
MRPALGGLILATAATMGLKVFIGFEKIGSAVAFDWRTLVILAVVIAVPIVYKKLIKKEFSPILLILISAMCGVLLFA